MIFGAHQADSMSHLIFLNFHPRKLSFGISADVRLCARERIDRRRSRRIIAKDSPPIDDVDYSDEIVLPMNPGDGLFFSNYTWHRSEPNRTGDTRMFYAIAYQLTNEAIADRD